MKAVVVALFALVAVASAIPVGPAGKTVPVPAPKDAKDDLKGAEAVYVASPYVASYPAVSAYSAAVPAVPAYSTYSAYSALPAYNYGYAAAPVAYAYYR